MANPIQSYADPSTADASAGVAAEVTPEAPPEDTLRTLLEGLFTPSTYGDLSRKPQNTKDRSPSVQIFCLFEGISCNSPNSIDIAAHKKLSKEDFLPLHKVLLEWARYGLAKRSKVQSSEENIRKLREQVKEYLMQKGFSENHWKEVLDLDREFYREMAALDKVISPLFL